MEVEADCDEMGFHMGWNKRKSHTVNIFEGKLRDWAG
jgi:hypothetical protein